MKFSLLTSGLMLFAFITLANNFKNNFPAEFSEKANLKDHCFEPPDEQPLLMSIADGELLNVVDTVIEPSFYGPIEVQVLCPYNIFLDGSASSGEDGYLVELSEFDLDTWADITVFYNQWICTGCTVPNNININSYFPPGEPTTGKIYKLKLAVGPEWSSKFFFFEIEGDQLPEIPACPTDITHVEPFVPEDGIYKSSNSIESSVIIENGENVNYDARNAVLLKAGFEVENGGEFNAAIGGCGPDFSTCLQLTDPHQQTIISNSSPVFRWRFDAQNFPNCSSGQLLYEITILKVNGETSQQAVIANNNVFYTQQFTMPDATSNQISFPGLSLDVNANYIWQLNLLSCEPAVMACGWSHFFYNELPVELPLAPDDNYCEAACPLLNDSGFNSNPQGFWQIHSGNPGFDPSADGCDDIGYVSLLATPQSSDIITQQLLSPFIQDRHYQMSLCVRTTTEKLRIQVMAHNGFPVTFDVDTDVALFSQTAHIPTTSSWSTIVLPVWTANKNFDNISILIVNENEAVMQGVMFIDNVCISEVPENPCVEYDITFDEQGNYTLPDMFANLIQSFGVAVTETGAEVNRGKTSDLYGHKFDTTTDSWYLEDVPPCHSIGGYIPQNTIDSLYSLVDTTQLNMLADIEPPVAVGQTWDSLTTFSRSGLNPVPPLSSSNACLYFDGIDDFVSTAGTATANQIGQSDFTIEAKIKADPGQFSANPAILSNQLQDPIFVWENGFNLMLYKDLAVSPYHMLCLELSGSKYFIAGNGNYNNTLSDGFCHHVAVTRFGDVLTFYIDGNAIGSLILNSTFIPLPSLYSTASIRIGRKPNNSAAFTGIISDARIWSYSRTQMQINDGRFSRISYNEPGLSVNFELQNEPGQIVIDKAEKTSAFLGSSPDPDAQDTSDPTPVNACCQVDECFFNPDPSKPFGGRDIVYVHGLQLPHLFDQFKADPSYLGNWPDDIDDFYSGDYHLRAADNWDDHIARELGDIVHPSNSYLVVAHPCDQRLNEGIHAVVSQIRNAMETGRGVVWAENQNGDIRQCFGSEIVIVSHSTGGLLISSLLGLGEMSVVSGSVQNQYGNFKPITDRVKAHVALNPALSGSPLARAGLVLGTDILTVTSLFQGISNQTPDPIIHLALDPLFVFHTVLVDLDPLVANLWGIRTYGNATCKTITAASAFLGLPQDNDFFEVLLAKRFLRGLDDGVLTIDCQCARQRPITSYMRPSRFTPKAWLPKNVDLGNPMFLKSSSMFLEMSRSLMGNPCVSGIAPTGMLTSIKTPAANLRWPNHYSLFQNTAQHYDAASDIALQGSNYSQGVFDNIDNYEESRVITDNSIYAGGLVHTSIQNDVVELVRKKTIGFHLPWVRKKRGFPWFEVYLRYFEIVIWKRTYHLMDGYQSNDAVSYMYKYVLKP